MARQGAEYLSEGTCLPKKTPRERYRRRLGSPGGRYLIDIRAAREVGRKYRDEGIRILENASKGGKIAAGGGWRAAREADPDGIGGCVLDRAPRVVHLSLALPAG